MKKEDKGLIIEQLGQKLQDFPHFYLVDVTGLNAEATSSLRRKCFKADIKMVVVKNTLLQKAFEKSDTDYSGLYGSLKGTTAVFFANVANAPARLIKEVGKGKEIPALKAAYAEEEIYVGAENLEALCALKSKNELIADVVALLQSPIKNVVSGLTAGNKIHGLLDAIAERNK
ncbi:MAG: 50S ribosomal protein L10 [Alloprevotella sp.]|nr:50S ribosomal protein L10 [Alloprevotella sp.]